MYKCTDQLITLRISSSRLFCREIEAVGQKLATSGEWKTIRSLPEIENCQNSLSVSLSVFLSACFPELGCENQTGCQKHAASNRFPLFSFKGWVWKCDAGGGRITPVRIKHHPETVFVNV
jgi:hypothetical protein